MSKISTPVSDPDAEIKAMQEAMIGKAASIPAVIQAAKDIFERTSAWAEEIGILPFKPKKKATAEAKELATLMDANYGNIFNDAQWMMMKEMFSVILGENVPTKKIGQKSSDSTVFVKGTAIKFTASKHGHAYPLGEIVFVNEPDEYKGIMKDGTQPLSSAWHFDSEPSSMQLPTEAEILSALANLYVLAREKYNDLASVK